MCGRKLFQKASIMNSFGQSINSPARAPSCADHTISLIAAKQSIDSGEAFSNQPKSGMEMRAEAPENLRGSKNAVQLY
jgi:hypothetical protein